MAALARAVTAPRPERLADNYFVAAYPPFACWREQAVGEWRAALQRPASGPLGLYVHVPFCAERCDYCYYLSYADRGAEMGRYCSALGAELARYAEEPAVAERVGSFVYFGGGTPSLLPPERIRELARSLQAELPWLPEAEVTFECAPRTVTAARLDALREIGVTRLSLGIQQLDDEVLALNGRVHRLADVEAAWSLIRDARFPTVNVDLIAGLVGQTDASFRDGIERVLDMGPDSVTVYLLEMPLNTPLYRAWRDGDLGAELPPREEARARQAWAFGRLEAAGYSVVSAYAAVRDPERHPFVYQIAQYGGADLLGLGASSFSYVGGVHQQNLPSLSGYLERVEAGRLPTWRAYALSADEQLVRRVVLQLKLGRVELAPLESEFGVDVRERFAAPLARLAECGWLDIGPEAIELTRSGLLRADHLVWQLFRPDHRVERYS